MSVLKKSILGLITCGLFATCLSATMFTSNNTKEVGASDDEIEWITPVNQAYMNDAMSTTFFNTEENQFYVDYKFAKLEGGVVKYKFINPFYKSLPNGVMPTKDARGIYNVYKDTYDSTDDSKLDECGGSYDFILTVNPNKTCSFSVGWTGITYVESYGMFRIGGTTEIAPNLDFAKYCGHMDETGLVTFAKADNAFCTAMENYREGAFFAQQYDFIIGDLTTIAKDSCLYYEQVAGSSDCFNPNNYKGTGWENLEHFYDIESGKGWIGLDETITSTPTNLFAECGELVSVDIPKQINNIGDSFCKNATSLEAVKVVWDNDDTLPTFSGSAFDNLDKTYIVLKYPNHTVNKYKRADVWKDFLVDDSFEVYEVTFDPNGGVIDPQYSKIFEYYYENYILPAEDPTKENYIFTGWFTDSEEGEEVTTSTRVEILKPTTLYAHYVEDSFVSIELKSAPSKTSYQYGEDLDLSGAMITLTKLSGLKTDIQVTNDMVNGYDKTKIGKQTINVTYAGLTTSFDVTVNDYITGITLKGNGVKTDYKHGEDLDLTGLQLKVGTASGSFDSVDVTSDMVSGYDKNKVGTQTLTITYQGFTTTYEVTVASTGLSGGAIAGIIIGSVVGVGLITCIIVLVAKKRKENN